MKQRLFKRDSIVGFRTCVLLLLALFLMIVDNYNGAFHRFRNHVAIVTVPIQYVVSLPINVVSWVITDFTSRQELLQENAHLRTELLLQKSQLQKQYATEAENQQLRALLLSSSQAQDRVTEAQLLAVAPDPFVRQVVLNKGKNSDVFVGQPVLDSYGVMGQVVQVGLFTSRVLLITDPMSAIPVQIRRNGLRVIAVGDPTRDLLQLKNVTDTMNVKEGDELVTSGLGQRYPFGYPVGKIISIQRGSEGRFSTVFVEPAAHLNRSRLVLLVWPVKTKISPTIKKAIMKKTSNVKTRAKS